MTTTVHRWPVNDPQGDIVHTTTTLRDAHGTYTMRTRDLYTSEGTWASEAVLEGEIVDPLVHSGRTLTGQSVVRYADGTSETIPLTFTMPVAVPQAITSMTRASADSLNVTLDPTLAESPSPISIYCHPLEQPNVSQVSGFSTPGSAHVTLTALNAGDPLADDYYQCFVMSTDMPVTLVGFQVDGLPLLSP